MRHGDADILQLLETTVPPADVAKVDIFFGPLSKYNAEVWINVSFFWVERKNTP